MKKIMFNDRFGLTQAVLDGRKTQTRRIMKGRTFSKETLLKKSLSARKNTFNWKPIMNVHTGKSYPSVTIARTMEGIKEHEIYKAIKNGEYRYL